MNNLKKCVSVILALTIVITSMLLISPSKVQATEGRTLYVSPVGNDTNDGLSESTPWRTLKHASVELIAGDTLLLRGGTYGPDDYFYPENSGTENAPITLKAYPSEQPIIDGENTSEGVAILLYKYSSYPITSKYYENFVFEGLTLKNNHYGVYTDAASHLVFKNCHFQNSSSNAFTLVNGTDILIENCTMDTIGSPAGDGSGDGIYLFAIDHSLFQNNNFTKCGHAIMDLMRGSFNNVVRNNLFNQHWGGGMGIVDGSNNNLIEDNIILNIGQEVTYPKEGIDICADKNIIRRNVVSKASDASGIGKYVDKGMTFLAYGECYTSMNNSLYNNVIYKSGGCALLFDQIGNRRIKDNKIFNNIIYKNQVADFTPPYFGNSTIALSNYSSGDAAYNWGTNFLGDNKMYNNIIMHSDNTGDKPGYGELFFWRGDANDNTNAPWFNSLAFMQSDPRTSINCWGNIEKNPQFVDADNDNFKLNSNSGAIDAGAHLAQTTAAGSNVTNVQVTDARPFCDGYNIVVGDWVKIGTNGLVYIRSIDYDNNTISVSSPVSFNQGDYVDLPYSGSAPDMGLSEYNQMIIPTDPPVNTPPPQDPNITIINNSKMGTMLNAFNYVGNWTYESGYGSLYRYDFSWTKNANDYSEVKFYGSQIEIYGTKESSNGIAKYSIIGETQEELADSYSDTNQYQVLLYKSPVLPIGEHVLKCVVTGNKNSVATDSYITIDFAKVYENAPEALITVNNSVKGTGNNEIEYIGNWADYAVDSLYSGDETYCDPADIGNSAKLKFSGTQVKVYGSMMKWSNIAGYSIDGGNEILVDGYKDNDVYSTDLLFDSGVLTLGAHTLTIRMTGTQNPSGGTCYELDKIEVINNPPTPTPPTCITLPPKTPSPTPPPTTPPPTKAPTPTPAPTLVPVVRYDFGSTTSALASGYLRVAEETGYTPGGYGFFPYGTINNSTDTGYSDPMKADYLYNTSAYPGTFKLDIPNGTYSVKVTQGSYWGPFNFNMAIKANGKTMASGINVNMACFVESIFEVTVTDGCLSLEFSSESGWWLVNGVEISLPNATPTATPTPATPTPVPTLDPGAIGNSINLQGLVSSVEYTDTAKMTNGVLDDITTTDITNPEIFINFAGGADLKAFSLVGGYAGSQSVFYRVFTTTDGTTWKEAGVDFVASYTLADANGIYRPDYSVSGIVPGNKISEDYDTFETTQGLLAVQPVIFKDVQVGVTQVKVVMYGNNMTQWYMWNSVAEINAYGTYVVPTPTPTPTLMLGDVNGDGKISPSDALRLLQSITGKVVLTDEQKVAADVTKNGLVQSSDALKILHYCSGKITTF